MSQEEMQDRRQNIITVSVDSERPHCGKTLVVKLLAKALQDAGLNNVSITSETWPDMFVEEEQQKHIDAVKKINPIIRIFDYPYTHPFNTVPKSNKTPLEIKGVKLAQSQSFTHEEALGLTAIFPEVVFTEDKVTLDHCGSKIGNAMIELLVAARRFNALVIPKSEDPAEYTAWNGIQSNISQFARAAALSIRNIARILHEQAKEIEYPTKKPAFEENADDQLEWFGMETACSGHMLYLRGSYPGATPVIRKVHGIWTEGTVTQPSCWRDMNGVVFRPFEWTWPINLGGEQQPANKVEPVEKAIHPAYLNNVREVGI